MNNERHFHGTSHLGKGGIDALVAANAGLPPIYDWEFFDQLGHHLQYGMWLTEVQAERQGHYIGATRSSKIMFPPGSLEYKLVSQAMTAERYGGVKGRKVANARRQQIKRLLDRRMTEDQAAERDRQATITEARSAYN